MGGTWVGVSMEYQCVCLVRGVQGESRGREPPTGRVWGRVIRIAAGCVEARVYDGWVCRVTGAACEGLGALGAIGVCAR